jgi:mRNA interferase MazF
MRGAAEQVARGASIRRGDIYWIAPEEDRGAVPPIPHPYVVVQDDIFNASRIGTVVVCGITSNLKRVAEPGTVLLDEREGGLLRRSVVLASQISSVPKAQLGVRIGALTADRVEQILAALRLVHNLQQSRGRGAT